MSGPMNSWPCLVCGQTITMSTAQQHAGGMCGNGSGFMNAKQYQPKDAEPTPAPAVVHAEGIWRIEAFGVAIEAPTLAGVLELAGHVDQLRAYVKR